MVKEELSKVCELTKKQKRLKAFSKNCCKDLAEPSLEYGCKPTYKKKMKHKKYVSKYQFKRKRRPFKSGKYVKKKSFEKSTNEEKKFCPKDKKIAGVRSAMKKDTMLTSALTGKSITIKFRCLSKFIH